MALSAQSALNHPAVRRVRSVLRSRLVLGVGYGVASALTGLAILLAASPPETGPLGSLSRCLEGV